MPDSILDSQVPEWQKYLGQPAGTGFNIKGDYNPTNLQAPASILPPQGGNAAASGFRNFLLEALADTGSNISKLWNAREPSQLFEPATELMLGAVGPGGAAKKSKSLLETGLGAYASKLPEEFKTTAGSLNINPEAAWKFHQEATAKDLQFKKPKYTSDWIAKMSPEEYNDYKLSGMTPTQWEAHQPQFETPAKPSWMSLPGAPQNYQEAVHKTIPPEFFQKISDVDYKHFSENMFNKDFWAQHGVESKLPTEPLPGHKYGTKDIGFSPTAMPGDDMFVIANGKKIGEITAPETSSDSALLYMHHWGPDADAREFKDLNAAIEGAKKSATGIKKETSYEQVPFGFTPEQWAMVKPEAKQVVLGNPTVDWSQVASAVPEMSPKGLDKYATIKMGQSAPGSEFSQFVSASPKDLAIPEPLQWGSKGFPWPGGEFAERAKAGGFTLPFYHGKGSYEPRGGGKLVDTGTLKPGGELYGGLGMQGKEGHNVANMYAGWLSEHPDVVKDWTMTGKENPQVVPMLLKPEDFHVVNAQGKDWTKINRIAMQEATDKGKHGVIIHNVGDEPDTGSSVLGPQSIAILFGSAGKSARFPSAKFENLDIGNLMAGLGGGAVLPWLGGQDAQQR